MQINEEAKKSKRKYNTAEARASLIKRSENDYDDDSYEDESSAGGKIMFCPSVRVL